MLEEIVSGIAILVLVIIIVLLGKIPSEDTSTIEDGVPHEFPQFNQESSQPVEYDPSLSVYMSATDNVSPNQAVRLDLQADDMVYKQTHKVADYDDDEDIEVENEGGVSITKEDIDAVTGHTWSEFLFGTQAEIDEDIEVENEGGVSLLDPYQGFDGTSLADGSSMSTLENTMSYLDPYQGFENKTAGQLNDNLTAPETIQNSDDEVETEEEQPQGAGEFQSASEAQRAATLAMYRENYAGNYTLRPPTS